jgi:hypothetical protein
MISHYLTTLIVIVCLDQQKNLEEQRGTSAMPIQTPKSEGLKNNFCEIIILRIQHTAPSF